MKKLLTLSAAVLTSVSMSADPITPARALQLAQEYIVPGHTMRISTMAKAQKLTTQNAPYYIISRGENQGYVIVAGDDCLPEILGYTEQGDFDASNIPPALQDMLDCWQQVVETAQADGSNVAKAAARKAQRRAANNRVNIAPFVTSHWGQGSPYNDNCPLITADDNSSKGKKALTGCVATAASQILYYWRRDLPSTLQATTPTYGYGGAPVTRSVPKGTPMKWDLMLDRYGSEPAEYKQEVAEFVFSVGAATWLTYGDMGGEATSGQIGNIPHTFSAYFGMNGGTVHYRDSYSQEGWTQLLYDELAKGRPVMYTGANPNNEGHAVFVHGYQASTDKFYFNFGWDGGGDGYYTTTLTDGMNGYMNYQSALIGAYPKSWNLKVDIVPPSHVYANIENEFTVKVTNNSTLDFSGVYLFAATSNSKPSKLSNAKSSDTETVIAVDGSGEITLSAKPTSDREWYITVTDANLNVLASVAVTPEVATSDLHLQGLSVDGSRDVERFADENFQVVYNNRSVAHATVANRSTIGYEGNQRMYFYVYDEETKDWSEVGYKTGKLTVDGNAVANVDFNISSTSACPFETGKYYMGKLANPAPSSTDTLHCEAATDTVVRFIMKDSDMEVVGFESDCLTLKGHFDATAFNSTSFATKSAYKTATTYDLTQCTGVNVVPQIVNPNALVYVADDSEASGMNIVKAGKCATLSLTPGYSFAPRTAFVAEKASITVGTEAAKWYLFTSPFAVTVPDGMIAREITSHVYSGITNKTKDVKTLEAGKTYLVMSSSVRNMVLTAENVTVSVAPVENADTAVVGTYVNTVTPAGAQLLNDEEAQYFVPMEQGSAVEALRGYWYASDLTKTFRAYSNLSLDPAYQTLAQNIEMAYQLLDKYSGVVKKDAYTAYLAKIQEAEREFSNREDTELSSAAKIRNYAAQLLSDGEAYKKQIAHAGNMEIDFTGNIENPSFETKSTKGWTLGTKEGYTSVGSVYIGTSANNYRAVGLDGSYVFQSLIAAADSSSVSISQQVEGLTPGYYRLTAMLGTDEHSTVTMFAGDSTVTVNGHVFGHLYLTKATIDNILVEAEEGETTGSLNIGVQEGRWYKADNFTLTYVGSLTTGDDEETAIDGVSAATTAPTGIYTLQGTKLSRIDKTGLYIIDGKKRFVRQ